MALQTLIATVLIVPLRIHAAEGGDGLTSTDPFHFILYKLELRCHGRDYRHDLR